MQNEDENVEYFVEHFKYSLQRLSHSDMEKGILNIILLRELREESLEVFNVLGNGVSQRNILIPYVNCVSNVHDETQGTKKEHKKLIAELWNHLVVGSQKQKLGTYWTILGLEF